LALKRLPFWEPFFVFCKTHTIPLYTSPYDVTKPICIYIYVYVYIYICICIYIYMYLYINIYKGSSSYFILGPLYVEMLSI
jgi:hypothetical protein